MLLFIALVNAPGLAPGGPAQSALLQSGERVANALMSLFVHARAYPVFAIMLGYGLVQLARRQHAAGATPAQVRTLLLRRNAWLFVFGCAHAALLYFGDFLGRLCHHRSGRHRRAAGAREAAACASSGCGRSPSSS